MSSRIITPPDIVPSKNSFLILNAKDSQLATLVLWLKTIRESYDIYVWHNGIGDYNSWLFNVAANADTILSNNHHSVPNDFTQLYQNQIIHFGTDTEYPDLIHYFLSDLELKV